MPAVRSLKSVGGPRGDGDDDDQPAGAGKMSSSVGRGLLWFQSGFLSSVLSVFQKVDKTDRQTDRPADLDTHIRG